MKIPLECMRIKSELWLFVPFVKSYFGEKLLKIILFGSFLSFFRFKQLSDIDIAIILMESEWAMSCSREDWDPDDDTLSRKNFFESLRRFRIDHSFQRIYDVKLYTEKDLELLREFQKERPPPRGGCLVDDILAGKILFDAQL